MVALPLFPISVKDEYTQGSRNSCPCSRGFISCGGLSLVPSSLSQHVGHLEQLLNIFMLQLVGGTIITVPPEVARGSNSIGGVCPAHMLNLCC